MTSWMGSTRVILMIEAVVCSHSEFGSQEAVAACRYIMNVIAHTNHDVT